MVKVLGYVYGKLWVFFMHMVFMMMEAVRKEDCVILRLGNILKTHLPKF